MDPWSYEQTALAPTLQEFLGLANRAEQVMVAARSELDAAPTEANNASIRRRVKMHVQSHTPQMQDVQADWVHKQVRQMNTSVYGCEEDDLDEEEY